MINSHSSRSRTATDFFQTMGPTLVVYQFRGTYNGMRAELKFNVIGVQVRA